MVGLIVNYRVIPVSSISLNCEWSYLQALTPTHGNEQSPLQKIPQHIMPMLGQDRLGMELHAFDIQRLVPHAHDFIDVAGFVLGPGGDFQAVGQGRLLDHQ